MKDFSKRRKESGYKAYASKAAQRIKKLGSNRVVSED